MDSLKIQDVFEPYYAGRERFSSPADRRPPVKPEGGQPLPRRSLADTEPPTEAVRTTEH